MLCNTTILKGVYKPTYNWGHHPAVSLIIRWFPKIGIPPQIIHFDRMFPLNHPFWGTPIVGNLQNNLGRHFALTPHQGGRALLGNRSARAIETAPAILAGDIV